MVGTVTVTLVALAEVALVVLVLLTATVALRWICQPRPRACVGPQELGRTELDEPELVALLTAAAESALSARVRLLGVHPLRRHKRARPTPEPWEQAGRLLLMESHHLQARDRVARR